MFKNTKFIIMGNDFGNVVSGFPGLMYNMNHNVVYILCVVCHENMLQKHE